jgi:lipopolysaccharide transport system ATP-binding protein
MAIAIKVENLSKAYQLGQIGTGTISRDIERWWAGIRGKEDPFLKVGEVNDRTVTSESNVVWSLKDINFEIQHGDAVGIIGRNGAGKSTLLKLLSRVTAPTSGVIKLKGRMASLLEVGTGFHPELTGRENIFLNGAILGMRKKEIASKLEEIIDFSGVEKYVDTPVKRYSSGMYVRLAFAVAAHLESEILVVDEVLAVGDAEFQKKCLGKMKDVSTNQGRTILFVSHNMGAVSKLCNKAILLNHGTILESSTPEKIIPRYLSLNKNNSDFIDFENVKEREGNGRVRFKWVEIYSLTNNIRTRDFSLGEDLSIRFCIGNGSVSNAGLPLRMAIELKTSDGIKLATMIDEDSNFHISSFDGNLTVEVILKDLRLYPDTYYLSLYVGDISSRDIYDYLDDCINFEVNDGGKLTTRPLPRSGGLLFYTPAWQRINE